MGGACYAANRGFAVRRNKLVAGGKPLFLSTLIAEKNMLKKLIMLAALALPCQLALAFENTIPLGSLSSPSFAPVTSSYGASFAGQSFTDHFTFSITPASVFNSFVATFDYPGVFGLTSFSTSLYTGGGTFVAGGVPSGTPPVAISQIAVSPLGAGSYDLRVSGTVETFGGSYFGGITVTPIPEPETYAMMLAGLGFIGFVASRRKRRAA